MSKLLPTHHEAFNSREYWDKFFRERDNEAFEWYGSYSDLSSLIQKHCRDVGDKGSSSPSSSRSCLIIGCGNSEFSHELHDRASSLFTTIRNLDFSEQVIAEMRSKNENNRRPTMHWDVGDMTNMAAYEAGQFAVVFDKGALDALMSTESADVLEQARKMFAEVARILNEKGTYMCVTLAEPYILSTLLQYFSGTGSWTASIEAVPSSKPSPFLPLLITLQKTVPPAPRTLSLYVNEWGKSLAAGQQIPWSDVPSAIESTQTLHRKSFGLRDIQVGRFETFELYAAASKTIPRFTITIVDADNSRSSTLSCAVLFLPSGREAEYQFSTQAGLEALAMQAGCKRLLAVGCNRPHIFSPILKNLQDELDVTVLGLRPVCAADEKIPYMAVAKDDTWETIADGDSAVSGKYVIEESDAESSNATAIFRRLLFLQNQNFVQTELRLVERKKTAQKGGSSGSSGGGGGKKSSSSKKSSKNAHSSGDSLEFDHTYMDAHHCAVLAGLTLCPTLIKGAMRGAVVAEHQQQICGLVVGLGGGAMPMCLQRYLSEMRLFVCDIDPELEALAEAHFAFHKAPKTSIVVGDGMDLLACMQKRVDTGGTAEPLQIDGLSLVSTASGSLTIPADLGALDLLFIDVDSKDTSLGMSAPPQSFVTLEALQTMHAVLRPGGLLALNVVARMSSRLDELLALLKTVFDSSPDSDSSVASRGKIFTVLASDEVVNVTVLALKRGAPDSAAKKPSPSAAKSASVVESVHAREALLDDWLRGSGLQSDPLQLGSLLDKFQLVK